jgi:hypothetical protein
MSSFARRIQLKKRRKITDTEHPYYMPPRDGATRNKVGQPYRRVKYVGSPERPAAYGIHYTKKHWSPSPAGLGGRHMPHHLLTLPHDVGKKGTHRRAQRKLGLL